MGLIRNPFRSYPTFARIFRLPGTLGLGGIQDEVVPTQDLNRMLQQSRVLHYIFENINTPAASGNVDLQWGDFSDWASVVINGVNAGDDGDMPDTDADRFLLSSSLQIGDTQGDYTSAQMFRIQIGGSGTLMLVNQFGSIVLVHLAPNLVGPNLLPQRLTPGETGIRLRQVVSGVGASFNWIFHMLVAEPGVLHPYPGM